MLFGGYSVVGLWIDWAPGSLFGMHIINDYVAKAQCIFIVLLGDAGCAW